MTTRDSSPAGTPTSTPAIPAAPTARVTASRSKRARAIVTEASVTRSLRGHDERVMRLTTVGHLHRNARAGRAQALRGVLDPGLVHVCAAVQREDLGVGQSLRRFAKDGLLVLTVCDDTPVEQGHRLTFSHILAVDRRVPTRAGHLYAVSAVRDFAHRLRVIDEAL